MKFFNKKKNPSTEEKAPDIKTLLKLARQYIDDQNMKEAQKCCKKVLRKNDKNYMALVLLGKAFENSEDAPKTLERAVEFKPKNPLAWQGLAKYYEGKDHINAKKKLLNIYTKILKLHIDDDYAIKTLEKYGQLCCLLVSSESISNLIEYIKIQKKEKLINVAEKQFLLIVLSEVPINDEDKTQAIEILKKINNTELRTDRSEIYLGELIFQNNDFPFAVIQIMELRFFAESANIKEWLCERLCKTFVEKDSFCGFDIDSYVDELTSGIENRKYGGTLQAIMNYRLHEYVEAYRKCSFSVYYYETDKTEALFMLNCAIMIKDVSLTESLVSSFLRKERLKNPEFVVTMFKKLLTCYIQNQKCYEGICIIMKIPIDQMESTLLTDMGKLFWDSDVNTGVILDILDSTDYLDLFKAFASSKSGRVTQAISVLLPYDKHPVKYYYLAQLYWKISQFAQCLQCLKKALELIPEHPKLYYCLGIYYYRYEMNIAESRMYFEKSYTMCNTDIDVIQMLSLIYDRLDFVNLEYNLLYTAVNSPETKVFWVYSRLGRICFIKKNMDDALMYLKKAIRLNSRDITAHEWIGDVFYSTQAYDLAISAYEKVVELSNDTTLLMSCLNRIASIYSHQSAYEKAIFMYDSILQVEPDNITALKGITKNRMIHAKNKSSAYAFRAARENIQSAVDHITSAMSRGIKDNIYWHLYGDTLVFITRLPRDYCFVDVRNAEGESRKGKIAMYEMAIESYANAAQHRDAHALFKCAHTYLEYYVQTKRITLWHTSYNLAVLTIKASPKTWRYWDLLGKVCYFSNKTRVAHYCFFKAIILNGDISAYKVWCNLGTFYLKINKDRLANYCFTVGRQCLPSYPRDWIGNGLLAEIIREDGNIGLFTPDPNSHEFEELTDLDFVDWVTAIHELSIPPNEPKFNSPIEAFYAVPHAIEIIEWYLSFEQGNAWGCSSLGHLKEEKGLLSSALSYYDKAYELAENELKNELLLHKARVLMKLQRYDEAVNVYSGVDEVNLEATCALGYALYKSGNYEQSYAAYNRALDNFCDIDNKTVDVLIAMSNVMYKINGYAAAQDLLLRVVQITSAPIRGRGFDLPFLKSYAFGRVDVELVAHIMTECLQIYYDDGMWWYYMGLNYLRGHNKYAKLASLCIQRAIDLSLDSEHAGEIGKMHAMISIAEFYSGDREEAMDYAKRALNVYPGQPELWAALILCVFSYREWPHRVPWIVTALYRVRQNIILPRSINDWLSHLQEKLVELE